LIHAHSTDEGEAASKILFCHLEVVLAQGSVTAPADGDKMQGVGWVQAWEISLQHMEDMRQLICNVVFFCTQSTRTSKACAHMTVRCLTLLMQPHARQHIPGALR
jgi:hypothetical protein